MGLNDNIIRYQISKIINFNNISQISTGETFSIILTQNNKLYSFGDNKYGQLGLGYIGGSVKVPTEIPLIFTNSTITKLSCGYYHTLLLDDNGIVYSFGLNEVTN